MSGRRISRTPELSASRSSGSPASFNDESISELTATLTTRLKEVSPTRLKRAHNKVRTGCITCRTRRVKCDENRPACIRCTKADRVCEGYYDGDTNKLSNVHDTAEKAFFSPQPCIAEIYACLEEDDMMRPVAYYLETAAPRLVSLFSSMLEAIVGDNLTLLHLSDKAQHFWRILIPRFIMQSPAIRYGVVALSSLHESAEAKQGHPGQNGTFVKYYNKAIAAAATMKSNNHPAMPEILCSCLVFAHCELLIGPITTGQFLSHIVSGERIALGLREAGAPVPTVITDFIEPILSCFKTTLASYGLELYHPSPLSSDSMLRQFPLLPTTFSDLADAAAHLQVGMYRVMLLRNLGPPYDKTVLVATRYFVNDWSIKFDSWRFTLRTEDPVYRKWHLLLLAQHRMMQLLLKTMPPESDINYHKAGADFRIMLAQISSLINIGIEDHDMQIPVHTGFIVPLFFIAANCRIPEIRQGALEALRNLKVVEGHWNSCMAYAIASKLVEIEDRLGKSGIFIPSTSIFAHFYLNSIERLASGKSKLNYTVTDPDGSVGYASSDTIDEQACHQSINMSWSLNRMIQNYGFQGPVQPRRLTCNCYSSPAPNLRILIPS